MFVINLLASKTIRSHDPMFMVTVLIFGQLIQDVLSIWLDSISSFNKFVSGDMKPRNSYAKLTSPNGQCHKEHACEFCHWKTPWNTVTTLCDFWGVCYIIMEIIYVWYCIYLYLYLCLCLSLSIYIYMCVCIHLWCRLGKWLWEWTDIFLSPIFSDRRHRK